MCVHTDGNNSNNINGVNWDWLVMSKNVKKKKKEKSSRILECILHLELKHSFFTLIFVGFISAGPRGPTGCLWQRTASIAHRGAGHTGREEKCLFLFQSRSCDGDRFVDWWRVCIFHPTVSPPSPDPVCHSPHLLSVENWDVTLRKYQLHCLQYHTPVWTHLLLLVGEQQRETGTETDRDTGERKETLSWSGTVILL